MKHRYLYMLFALIVSCSIDNSNPIITEFNQLPEFGHAIHYLLGENDLILLCITSVCTGLEQPLFLNRSGAIQNFMFCERAI